MAKLTARGAHKVVTLVFDISDDDDKARGTRVELYYALRSDGHILRKIDFVRKLEYSGETYRQSGNYSKVTTTPWPAQLRNKDEFRNRISKMRRAEPIRES